MTQLFAGQRRGIALDMDGVITDSMHFHVAAWLQAFEQFGVEVEEEWIYLLEGVIAPKVITLTLEKYQNRLSPDDQKTLHQIKTQRFQEIFSVIAIPGIHVLVDLLRGYGYALAVVTGSSREVARQSLLTLGIDAHIGCLIGGEDVQQGKPNPEPYLKAVSAMNTAIETSLVIENAPAGIEAAHSAGVYCIAVTTTLPSAALTLANEVMPDLEAVALRLRREYEASGGIGAWKW